jgi:hypothetical protein
MDSPPYNALLQMAIEHGRQLERVLQLTENLEDRQDDMKNALDYLLKTINGNGDGRGGLKTWAIVHENELHVIKKELEELKKSNTDNHDVIQVAKSFFNEKRQFNLNWKHLVTFGLLQALLLTLVELSVQQVWVNTTKQTQQLHIAPGVGVQIPKLGEK